MRLITKLFRRNAGPREALSAASAAPSGTPPITIYTTGWCASCLMAKRYLQQKGVPYEEVDIERVPEAAARVMSLARGYKTVPTMIIGDSVVIDWDRRALEAALQREGFLSG